MPGDSNGFDKSNGTPEAANKFWQWFVENEERFRDYEEQDSDKTHDFLDELIHELKPFNPWLKALAGGDGHGKYELILTADGDIALFPKVEQLIDIAPKIEGWKLTAHKPPLGFDQIRIDMYDKEFSAETVNFYALTDPQFPDEVNIVLTHPAYKQEEDEQFQTAGMIYLENGLGELNTAVQIDKYVVGEIPDESEGMEIIPITKLNEYLNWRQKEFVEKYESRGNSRPEESYTVLEAKDNENKPMFATIDSGFRHWEYRSAFPWLLQIDINYKGDDQGLPDNDQMENLQQLEDEIVALLVSDSPTHYTGHRTYDNYRSIYFYTNNFSKASRILHKYLEENHQSLQIVFFIRKDKYWHTMEQFYGAADE
jgi:hypothetical protein